VAGPVHDLGSFWHQAPLQPLVDPMPGIEGAADADWRLWTECKAAADPEEKLLSDP